jgi:NAD(P)-dependent dehydrogenase (short-subunit alcohol dehydrogenase family)
MRPLLDGKVVIVVGGAGVLGSSFARAIIKNGGRCIIADKNKGAGNKLCADIRRKHKNAPIEFRFLDTVSELSVTQMLAYVFKKYKRIDALVNTPYPKNKDFGGSFEKTTYRNFCENVNLHLGGYFLSCQKAALFFKKQKYGNIVNIASVYGVIPPRFQIYKSTKMANEIEYAAMKAGIIHMTKYIAKYFKGSNIRANCISPGGILAGQPGSFLKKYREFCSSKGMLDSADIDGTLIYLLSGSSAMVNGQNIIVDDGFTL